MNPKQPFYVDVGTSIVAIRCTSNHDVIVRYDHVLHPHTLELAKDICDRMNREVEIHNSGNSAALREALIHVQGWLKRMNAEPLNTLAVSELTPSYAVNRTAKSIIEDNDYHISQLTAALSAPPRNCDLPKVAEDPWRAWLDDKSNWEDGNPKLEIHDWLLAPATEEEGGAN